jgi:hypothetical protein
MPNCHACGESLKVDGMVGRGDECPKCRGDLRCCKNCEYYDPNAYNECRETVAERVVEKHRSNFCSFFRIAEERLKEKDRALDAKKKLEELFRKKGGS